MGNPTSARIPASRTLLIACFGAFLAFIDATIVNVAFPSIRASFPETSISGLSWVLNAYNIVFAAFLIVAGRATDLLGRRRMFAAGTALFTLASVACGLAPSVEVLVAFRVVQALGAAMIVPASLALVIAAFPAERRAHAIGIWGAAAAAAAGLGPPIGGALVQWQDWRWAFFVNLPFGVIALVAARRSLVESRAPGRRTVPDLLGAMVLIACLALLNLGIVKGGDWGWTSAAVLGTLAASAVLLGVFVVSSRRHRSPLVDPTLLRLPSFSIGSLATVVGGFGFYAYLLTNILWLQYVWRYDVLESGLAIVPGALVAAIVASRLGPLAERYGYRPFIVPGALVWAGAYLWYHQMVGVEPAFWSQWMPGQILSGIGVGATLPLLGSASLAAVPGGRYATASAVSSSARQLGGVLGIAILVVILGEPTPATMVQSFRDGWMLSIIAFVLVALVALPLGRVHAAHDDDVDDEEPGAQVLAPTPPSDWAVAGQVGSGVADLEDIPLLAGLDPAVLQRLRSATRVIEVAAGETLIEQGGPAGSAYLVRRGRLVVEIDGRKIRELGPGDVLGELALITGEPRSATVRARRDTIALEIPREAFEATLAAEPSAAKVLLAQVADRLRTSEGPSLPPPERVSAISVVGLHPGAEVDDVAERLVARMRQHLTVATPGQVGPDGLHRAEQDADRVVLVAPAPADGASRDWWEFSVRQADAVVFVGDARRDVATPALNPALQPEVVLLGAAPPPARRVEWVEATDAWQLVLVDGDRSLGLRALADRLAGRSLGLVLAGGAARAFSHIGVLRELEEAGLYVDRVAGTSMGSILAAGHALGVDGATLEEMCYAEFVRRRPFNDWRLPTQSLAAGRRVREGLERAFGADTVIEGLPRQLSMVSVDLLSRTRQVHRRGPLARSAQASSRLPVLFSPESTDDGRLLIDGGVLDNLPADLLAERDEGPMVAVSIGSGTGTSRRTGRPRIPALGDTLMRTMMINSGGAVEAARRRGAWVLIPASRGVGLLEFHQFDRMVEAGRASARRLLEATGGELGAAVAAATVDEPERMVSSVTM